MLSVLKNRTYRHLFLAQMIALLGTGLGTIALGLLAFELAGENAGEVLGTALAIKMLAYVFIAPVAGAFAAVLPRRKMLVTLDLVRAGVVVLLPFVSEVWHVYVLIFALQSASAAFTPTFQATIPDVLPDERAFTKALSLSRLAYDLENIVSPALAALLLTLVTFNALFVGTAAGFAVSAALVLSVGLPPAPAAKRRSIFERTMRGLRIYVRTPRLRGLFAVNLAVASAGALVIVNTVVYVQGRFALSESETALSFGAFGLGSMLAALAMPWLLERINDRTPILSGAAVLGIGAGAAVFVVSYPLLLCIWFVIGTGTSMALTPSARLLKRSAHDEDRPALFAAQFALSHLCWLATYPIAGWIGSTLGLDQAALVLAVFAWLGLGFAIFLWPREDDAALEHVHSDLAPDHPHLNTGERHAADRHAHSYVIDDLHHMWPHGR